MIVVKRNSPLAKILHTTFPFVYVLNDFGGNEVCVIQAKLIEISRKLMEILSTQRRSKEKRGE